MNVSVLDVCQWFWEVISSTAQRPLLFMFVSLESRGCSLHGGGGGRWTLLSHGGRLRRISVLGSIATLCELWDIYFSLPPPFKALQQGSSKMKESVLVLRIANIYAARNTNESLK